jgi:NitT/TauT family transport system ATP-binding protein
MAQGPDTATQRGSAIEIDRVTKAFPVESGQQFQALSEVTLRIKPGEFVSVVGPSGCGKSTLMLMTAGLLSTSTGEIRVGGKPLTSPLTDVGIVFQDALLLDFRTALDNVLLQGKVRHMDMRAIGARAEELLEQLGVADAKTRYPRQLSGGMRQRVAIARALVHNPSLILMDEPFGALDALTRLQVRYDLEALWMSNRQTVLFITHSVEEAVGLSDRVIVMSPSPGRVIQEVAIDLARPRPLALGEIPELSHHVDQIYNTFEQMGVIHSRGPNGQARLEQLSGSR